MKRLSPFLLISFCLMAIIFMASTCNDTAKEAKETIKTKITKTDEAFKNHRDSVPSKEQYSGPLFELSHDYPTTFTPVVDPSWQQSLKGQPISSANVFAYMDALKKHIEPNIVPFFKDNKNWTAAKYSWYQQPWMSASREAILGSFLGNGNPAGMFNSLKEEEAGYALVLYDKTAGYALGKVWGETGEKLNLVDDAAQFPEGSVIVKFAFSNINYPQWPPMENAQTFSIYDTIRTSVDKKKGYQIREVSFFQMDVVVKDSKTAPKTGWVYSTFVHDKDVNGTFWDKMVPLGAMWGNDPDVNSPISPPYPPLKETVINPNAPFYSTETLGWGGRLSGPNDGSVLQKAVIGSNTTKVYKNMPVSSCMSCHSPAEYHFQGSLLPISGALADKTPIVYKPGSSEWMKYFRDDKGYVPFTDGQIALDYDMVTTLGAIGGYTAAKKAKTEKEKKLVKNAKNARIRRLSSK